MGRAAQKPLLSLQNRVKKLARAEERKYCTAEGQKKPCGLINPRVTFEVHYAAPTYLQKSFLTSLLIIYVRALTQNTTQHFKAKTTNIGSSKKKKPSDKLNKNMVISLSRK